MAYTDDGTTTGAAGSGTPAARRHAPEEAPFRWRWAALAALLAAEAMNLLDSTIVQVAAPVIRAGLGGGASGVQWFGAAYTLPFGVLLITGGRLGDVAGRKRVFRAGVLGFALASLACALAPTAGVLIAARAAQGAAAALVVPQTFGLIRAMFRGPELARALGGIGPVMGLAAVCGPVLGAVLTRADLFGTGWRSVFLVNLPLAAVVLACARLLPADSSDHADPHGTAARRPRLDLAGTALAGTGTALLTLPLIEGADSGWPAWCFLVLVAGAGALGLFALQQRRLRSAARTAGSRAPRRPLIEPGLLSERAFSAALVTSALFFAVLNGLILVVVLHLQLGLGRDAFAAGMTLVPWSAGSAIASWAAGARLVPRYGTRLMPVGLALFAAGLMGAVAAYAACPPGGFPWPLLAALGVAGVGSGLFTVPFFTAALERVAPAATGSAAGLLNAVQQLGATAGTAVLGSVFLRGLPRGVDSGGGASSGAVASPGAATASLSAAQHACWLALALLAAAAVTARRMRTEAAAHRESGSQLP
ncbi:MFS transporter [Streptomyces sp. ODS28]|uniref:MFS transporter n=1 Tax=Streptomyces sp. ODS28 TaxID=3136688 RepID=UPI0031EBA82C